MSGTLEVGDVVGDRYEILQYIGEGGMQFVYAARDRTAGRRVALKTPKNKSATKRFKRSAIVAAKVNHPNVAKTLDYLKVGDQRFLIEELIEGEDLAKALLQESSFLDPYLAAKVFHHLAKGVAAAHHAGVVHRDLKPTNVMIVGGYSIDELKVTDFGIAKMAEEELEAAAEGGTATLTTSQTAVGALPYMAPEAIESPKEVTSAADTWSLGAMMFHLMAGSPPFGSGLKAVKAILNANEPSIPPFVTKNPQFAPLATEIMTLALSCLKKEPGERPTADDLVKSCEELCYTSSRRRTGVVVRFDFGAYGFINDGGGDTFFHKGSVYGPECPGKGDRVMYSSFDGGGAPRAHPVVKLKPNATA
ncbi:MAG TPA: protein kinase [Pirellulales bacterium]|jgi:serine/threonine-protein kinase|nr:protein kinase [Pirellulales bacterium]